MASLQLYALIPQTHVLGPFTRFALWVQGCPFRCHDCMTPDALRVDGGTSVEITELAQQILNTPTIEGITLSGGEPFAQSAELLELIHQIKRVKSLGIIVYSGYTLEQLQKMAKKHPAVAGLLDQIDVLIDGLYIAEQNDGLSLRGSKNQQIHALTPRYAALIAEYYAQSQRAVEMHLLADTVMLVGIPGINLLSTWQTQIKKQS
ncbi:4Fe-4S single cluster domain-containing protein [Beggiatoa leptomitoformis]|uniref:4Fe-4S cluster-binding domain-containing protein n=1 Tax=Beggiatoa leptomitoformis TaxID=288004 RepID=A0A2N9YI87_9GAMM|nr:4Fe-4S single cluster domain-containing protein [Beggiatoa leptomitoformis]ALG67819.1 4Fe-4S cluster-binding domain-containing protein [Beggiatoa leptomitoformis]AUI69926.1 4Fe-4S cluster-binding domain-containing protein [Beggiatoa leptomitoformis]